MRKNPLKTAHAKGHKVVNGWMHFASSYAAEVMGHQGFDSVTVDMQHGPIGFEACVAMMTAISTTPAVPMVRVPWNEPAIIMAVLDAGAYGIICPMVNSAAEAKALAGAARYAPLGGRSLGANRANLYAGHDYTQHANEEIIVLAMIETREALADCAKIVGTPGISGTYIGPSDLAASMGKPPTLAPTDPEVLAALAKIHAETSGRGLISGTHSDNAATAKKRLGEGFHLVSIASDSRFLASAASAAVREARGADSASERKSGGY